MPFYQQRALAAPAPARPAPGRAAPVAISLSLGPGNRGLAAGSSFTAAPVGRHSSRDGALLRRRVGAEAALRDQHAALVARAEAAVEGVAHPVEHEAVEVQAAKRLHVRQAVRLVLEHPQLLRPGDLREERLRLLQIGERVVLAGDEERRAVDTRAQPSSVICSAIASKAASSWMPAMYMKTCLKRGEAWLKMCVFGPQQARAVAQAFTRESSAQRRAPQKVPMLEPTTAIRSPSSSGRRAM